MTEFSDKLMRLHSSRIRATETTADGAEKRVFVAERESEAQPEPAPAPAPEPYDTPARHAIRRQLVLGAGRLTSSPRRPPPSAAFSAQTTVGMRLADLRREANAILTTAGVESALPLLHEMLALSPSHPWALKHLVSHWTERGESTLATLYADRLAAAAPY